MRSSGERKKKTDEWMDGWMTMVSVYCTNAAVMNARPLHGWGISDAVDML